MATNLQPSLGRRPTLFMMTLISAAAFMGAACSTRLSTMYLSLFFAGFVKGAFFVLYTYSTEIVSRFHRTTACSFIVISAALGSLFGCLLATATIPQSPLLWRPYLGILSLMHLFGFFLLFYCGETPRFLSVSGHPSKAMDVIRSFNPAKNQKVELKPAKVAENSRGSITDLIKNPECLKNVIIVTMVMLFINSTAIGTIQLFLESLQNPKASEHCILVESFGYRNDCRELTTYDYALQSLVSASAFLTAFLAKFMPDLIGRRSFLLIDGYLTAVCTSLFLFCVAL